MNAEVRAENVSEDMETVKELKEEAGKNEDLAPYIDMINSYQDMLEHYQFDAVNEAGHKNTGLFNNYIALKECIKGQIVRDGNYYKGFEHIKAEFPEIVEDATANPVLDYLYSVENDCDYKYYEGNIDPYDEYLTSFTIFYQFEIFTKIMNELLKEYNSTEKTTQDYNNLVQQLAERLQVELLAGVLKY